MIVGAIYKITNIINGKQYIGSTKNIRQRKNRHFSDLENNKHSNKHLQSAFNKYGKKNFNFMIIEYITEESFLSEREQFWIDKLNTKNESIGYNICDASRPPVIVHTEETKENLRQKLLGRKFSEETILKMKKSRNNWSDESRENNRISQIGKVLSKETREKISKSRIEFHKTKTGIGSKKVICIDTGEVFESTVATAKHFDLSRDQVRNVCHKRAKTALGLHFMFLNEYNSKEDNNG